MALDVEEAWTKPLPPFWAQYAPAWAEGDLKPRFERASQVAPQAPLQERFPPEELLRRFRRADLRAAEVAAEAERLVSTPEKRKSPVGQSGAPIKR